MSPVFGHGHLRLYLLSLLAEEPRHGYELIQALGRSFGGTYVPSAGTIYPRLAKLEEDGLVADPFRLPGGGAPRGRVVARCASGLTSTPRDQIPV